MLARTRGATNGPTVAIIDSCNSCRCVRRDISSSEHSVCLWHNGTRGRRRVGAEEYSYLLRAPRV